MAAVALKCVDPPVKWSNGGSYTHFGHSIKKYINEDKNFTRFNVKPSSKEVPGYQKRRDGYSKDGGSFPKTAEKSEAIKALGPLFKQTQIHLRDKANPPLLRKPTSGTGRHNVGSTTGSGLIPTLPPPQENAKIGKYWKQRYLLFSRFDEGVKMDVEGWFSVTPEAIAKHHAMRCGGGTIVDCFTGVGGNVIQFSQTSQKVIAIDIDPLKLHYAKHNSAIYGVDPRTIEFVLGDSMIMGPKLKGDVVFMSPPWGGPDYAKQETFDMKTMLKPCNGQILFNLAKKIAPRVVMFLPRNVDINQLAELAFSATPPWSLEVEKNYLNGKLKAITAYFRETK